MAIRSLGRSLGHLIETIEQLEKRGVGFKSLQEAIDTTTPGGRLVFHVFGPLAEFERHVIVERTQAGLKAARAWGRHGGRPSVMSAEKVEVARRMYESREYTVAAIASTLGGEPCKRLSPPGSLACGWLAHRHLEQSGVIDTYAHRRFSLPFFQIRSGECTGDGSGV